MREGAARAVASTQPEPGAPDNGPSPTSRSLIFLLAAAAWSPVAGAVLSAR